MVPIRRKVLCLDLLHLSRLREPACLELRENELFIDSNVEDPVTPGNQLRLNTQTFTQFISQTGSIGFIVSHRTIMDFNFHVTPPANPARMWAKYIRTAQAEQGAQFKIES